MIDNTFLFALIGVLGAFVLKDWFDGFGSFDSFIAIVAISSSSLIGAVGLWEWRSKFARERRLRIGKVEAIPAELKIPAQDSIHLGRERDLDVPVFLPNDIRRRHVHVVGATGSGKTESVVLSFLRQDIARKQGAIILDAKGDDSFLSFLKAEVPGDKLAVFDLGSDDSCTYNPLFLGSAAESSQRLFASLKWSEEYYQSKAIAALQRIFESFLPLKRNPTILEISEILETASSFSDAVVTSSYTIKSAQADFSDLSGLKDQVSMLAAGALGRSLSPSGAGDASFEGAASGKVLYFRLQSLLSPKLVCTVGKLLINNLNYMAGTAHRRPGGNSFVPVFLDEFASFACPEFGDLISKARSAGYALHFSHQSIGDLAAVDEGFLGRITDNSGTKIVMRVNDPDTAEFFSRSFGTEIYEKVTQRAINAKELDLAEASGEGSIREAHRFRASPDALKTLPTGVGAVLVAHGRDLAEGGSTVFKIQFPRLEAKSITPELAAHESQKPKQKMEAGDER